MKKNKLGQRNPDHWGTISQYKPKKWRVIDGKKKIYSSYVEIYDEFYPSTQLGFVDIPYHVIFNKNGYREVDEIELKEYLYNRFKCEFDFDIGFFSRDTIAFPFVIAISTFNEEQVKKILFKEERINKIKSLL